MDISLIIPTWNNSQLIRSTLEALISCTIPRDVRWECVVVDNNSTDATKETVLAYTERLPLKYVFEPNQGLSNARNAGIKESSGALIIFADDDIEPCKDWLSIYWNAYRQEPSGFYWGGPIESSFEKGSLSLELAEIAPSSVKGFDLGKTEFILSKEQYFLGANWACPSVILKKLNGFDPQKGLNPADQRIKVSEETDLMGRLNAQGWKGRYLPNAKIRHFVPLKKMSIDHIAARWEAWGYEVSSHYTEHLKNPLVFGIPASLLNEGFSKWKNYILKRCTGRNWYKAYVQYIEFTGIIKGLRDFKNQHV